MKPFYYGDRVIGPGHPVFVIAEAGANHDRKFDQAINLIDTAVCAGADVVKFQTYSAKTMYSKKTPEIGYIKQRKLASDEEGIYGLIERIAMPREWQKDLAAYCTEKKIIFMSTPFDLQAVDELMEVGVEGFKIASYEITHLPLLSYCGQTGKPIILSTGGADLGDIELALETIYETGNTQVALLHCAINYPPAFADLNLRNMDTLAQAFDVPVGFSDHTMGITADIAAVAKGASIIEKHFTLSRTLPGPDHSFALEPDELCDMVRAIRDTEAALGSPIKRRTAAEQEHYQKGRRSLVAARNIEIGHTIAADDLTVKRPGFGIHPRFMEIVVGRKAALPIEEDDVITWEMI